MIAQAFRGSSRGVPCNQSSRNSLMGPPSTTNSLVGSGGLPGAPVFPSLIQEGRSGGYDVGISSEGWTYRLQFKVSQLMKPQTAMHWGEYGHPYFRFPLRPDSYSDQTVCYFSWPTSQNLR